MKRKIVQRNKGKYSALIRIAHSNDMPLNEWVGLVKILNRCRHDDKEVKRYGRYADWESAEYDGMWLWVPNRSCKDKRVLNYCMYPALTDLPEDKQAMYQAQFNAKDKEMLSEEDS